MKIKFNLFLSLLIAFFSYSNALAQDTLLPLFTANSDAFSGTLTVSIAVDQDSNTTGLSYQWDDRDTSIPLSNLSTGTVLFQNSGKNVVTLSGTNFSSTSGGPLVLTYLHDAISNDFEVFNLGLSRNGQNWSAYTTDENGIPHEFTSMFLSANTLFGKVIGIDNITVK